MLDEPRSRRRSTLHLFLFALAIAGTLGAIETVKGYVAGRSAPNDFGWAEAVLTNMPWWLLWALIAPLVFWLVRAVPLRKPHRVTGVMIHLIASVCLSQAHLVVAGAGVWLAVAHEFTSIQAVIRQFIAGFLVSDMVTYWAVVAAYATYDSQQRLRDAERARHELQVRAALLEAKMTEARLDALRMELNPHFLFNTLHTASALARDGEGDLAVEVLARLSELLRRTLYEKTEHEVTLEEEVDLLEQYLAIQRIRFRDRLTVDVRLPRDLRHALVPTLILQPLAENAMLHGISAVRGRIELQIHASREDDDVLQLVMRDSGAGFDSTAEPLEAGIGLSNTRDRLSTLYGDLASVEWRSPAAGGTEVILRIPLRLEEALRVCA